MTPPRPYSFSSYDPAWLERFVEIRKFLISVFGKKARRIEHVGSTAVPGMGAKPIIDVLIVVETMEPFIAERGALTQAGYESHENYIAPDSLLFTKSSSTGERLENVHVFTADAEKTRQFLVIRDYLRAHPDQANTYAHHKADLHEQHPDDYAAYRSGKQEFLVALKREAYTWDDYVSNQKTKDTESRTALD